MIKVNLYKDRDGNIMRYKIYGHGDHGPYGQDIVCAGVSVLSQTALISLVEVLAIDEDKILYTIDQDGYLDVSLPEDVDYNTKNEIQIVMKTMEVGIKSIIESYPENVTLKYREV